MIRDFLNSIIRMINSIIRMINSIIAIEANTRKIAEIQIANTRMIEKSLSDNDFSRTVSALDRANKSLEATGVTILYREGSLYVKNRGANTAIMTESSDSFAYRGKLISIKAKTLEEMIFLICQEIKNADEEVG